MLCTFRGKRQAHHKRIYLRQTDCDVPTVDGEESLDVDDYAPLLLLARFQSPQYSGRFEVSQIEVVGGAGMGEERPLRAAD